MDIKICTAHAQFCRNSILSSTSLKLNFQSARWNCGETLFCRQVYRRFPGRIPIAAAFCRNVAAERFIGLAIFSTGVFALGCVLNILRSSFDYKRKRFADPLVRSHDRSVQSWPRINEVAV